MDLIAKGDGPSSLLEGSTACDVLANLSCDLQDLLHQFGSSDEVLTAASNGQWKQMTALGAQESPRLTDITLLLSNVYAGGNYQ